MIKLPKMYTANSIKAMHEKLNLDAETVMLLYDYFDAFSNFYEMLPLKDAYTNDIMGYAQDPIVFSNEQGGNELYEKVKEVMVYGINENGLPATMFEDTIKSGGMFGTKCPLLMIRHSDSSCRFFMIGIFVYGNQVMFALFGESAENTKYNRKQYYQENGNFIKAALIKPDEFKLQSELQWREDILNVFNNATH